MAKIETTTKKFKEGIRLTADKSEVQWESTGHLSVRLFDATGALALAGRKVSVDVPGEGKVELEADEQGKVFHPDVPFQDYELDLGDGVKVHAPAVSNPGDVQERHVPGIAFAFVRLHVRNAHGIPCPNLALELSGPGGTSLSLDTDRHGVASRGEAVPSGAYMIESDQGKATITLPDFAEGVVVVQLQPNGGDA